MELIDYTLGGILEKWVREQPDHEFMIYPDRGLRFSYKEFDERVDIFAKGLLAIGVRKGIIPGFASTLIAVFASIAIAIFFYKKNIIK